MAKLNTRFNAQDHDTEQRDYEDLPAGIMQFEIEASEIKETGPEHARTGNGMKYTVNVLAPEEVSGRKFFGFINLENTNAQAQEIGQREFASLCRAMGVEGVEDTEELHYRTYTVKLGLGKPSKKLKADGSPEFPARMEVKRYFFPDQGNIPEPALDAVQTKPAAANDNRAPAANDNRQQQQASRPAAAATGSRPWGKK
ncbi:hypothetical protein B5M44_04330 [Shinella sumterensis]|uniref:hypothetical protein n=1 Tax=Shinella sumterensis TaxID=1967501 RepID=UPI00106E47D1|nr:hypothetical protein [Shinella sumterensis]MCD1264030.1 hypothetical protein [Shinella sumterensis]TFE99433.1 hypothetical protein B5M44_04330 [Shinella sumterensis]